MTTKMGRRRANLRDVAAAAGVSVATVSRVLNAPEAVTQETRTRVQAAIDELRFVPSAAARAINSGRTRIVGALIPTLDNAIFARFLDAVESQLAPYRLSLIVATTSDDPKQEAEKAQRLVDIGVEGLIVSGITHSDVLYRLIERTQLPAIATSYFDAGYRFPTIGYDNRAAAEIALRHLTELGHRDIAVIHGPKHNNDRTRARIAGLKDAGLPVRLSFHQSHLSLGGGSTAANRILSSGKHVSALLCLSDVLATGALFTLRCNGIEVPRSMSLMGIDDLPASTFSDPPLTTVRLPVREMGCEAGKALADWVEQQQVPQSQELWPELIVRQSTAGAAG
ncbi:substrate-binding domain-containing protein [Paracoccus benzoatiresistens]|uniref:Substrate-binding domain-containing protein n=1 Tax=Paracoccus benzoatiresistens TaxID=2997341 RepID=A0ABT4J9H4_9RHOB|nr:substrate-binding domain-containing protein [Paracoccus sp. EF6]MCZ0963780.1 substrate-binding domain-containing protein [Paracoccus sp. EF6]